MNGAADQIVEVAPALAPDTSPGTLGARDVLRVVRAVRSAGGALLDQAALHGQLAQVEWTEEKRRIARMLLTTLLGFAFLQCLVLLLAMLVLMLSWDTPYRVPATLLLILLSGLGCGLAWRRLRTLVAAGERSFAATREELAADLAVLRGRL